MIPGFNSAEGKMYGLIGIFHTSMHEKKMALVRAALDASERISRVLTDKQSIVRSADFDDMRRRLHLTHIAPPRPAYLPPTVDTR